jgi:hypothetical protein
MTSTTSAGTLAGLAARFTELVDELHQADLIPGSDDAVVEFWRAIETQTRRLAAVDHQVIVEVERRGLPGMHACASTVAFARQVLNVAPAEAKARVEAAHRLGPRQFPGGPVLPPEFPPTAAAVAEGVISARHAAVITAAVDHLPDEIVDDLGDWVETHLLEQAHILDAGQLARHAHDLASALDQDGRYRELDHQQRRRDLRLVSRPDGRERPPGGVLHRGDRGASAGVLRHHGPPRQEPGRVAGPERCRAAAPRRAAGAGEDGHAHRAAPDRGWGDRDDCADPGRRGLRHRRGHRGHRPRLLHAG